MASASPINPDVPVTGKGRNMKKTRHQASQAEKTNPFAPWPTFEKDEIDAAVKVLLSGKVNYWTGTECRTFETEFARMMGSTYAVALANGTLALEAALMSLDIGPGDEVIVPSRTYVASASSIAWCGAKPVFADVDPESQNITAATIQPLITTKTRAIIVVHLAGWPCDMDPIMNLARKHKLKVIEDCAQALGAKYKGRYTGTLGHIGAFSFCQDKIMTTAGEGGMVTTNDSRLWDRIWSLKDHGKKYATVHQKSHPPGFRWLVESFGSNWRMTEIQGAIGRVILPKLNSWVETRRRHAAFLNRHLSEFPLLRLTIPPRDFFHAYYKFYAFLRPMLLKEGWSRDRILETLNGMGIPAFVGSCSEVYREKAFKKTGLAPKTPLKTARELGNSSLMFLCHHTLSQEAMEKTARDLTVVLKQATR